MSSARISASLVLPKLVRSPHSTSTSAELEISANISRYGATLSSCTWRSPIAATRSLPFSLTILLFEISYCFGKAPLLDVHCVIAGRKNASAADLLARTLHVRLVAQPLEQLVHDPARDHASLARIDETEVEQRHQQHFPIELHVAEQLLPVDRLVA